MPLSNRYGWSAAFTLVELMIVVVIVSLLSMVAMPAFVRYMRRAKTAEAQESLSKIATGAKAYRHTQFINPATGKPLPAIFPRTVDNTPSTDCCRQVGGKCSNTSWADPTWQALRFILPGNHYYWYNFNSFGVDTTTTFTSEATGDLDCDGVEAIYSVTGYMDSHGGVQTRVVGRPDLEIE